MLQNGDDDVLAMDNAQWLLNLQAWIQEQGLWGLVPVFGNFQTVRAEDGRLQEVSPEGTAVYSMELTFHFTRVYEVMEYGKN